MSVAPGSAFQIRDFTVAAGVILQVPSGSVIRCTRECVNLGTIVVLPGEQGGTAHGGARAPAGKGVAHRAAGFGAVGDVNGKIVGGEASRGLSEPEARSLWHVGPGAGGARGACGGDGSAGGGVPPGAGGSFEGQPGDPGYVLESEVDPTLLF